MSGKRLVFRMYKSLSKFNILKKSNFAIEKKKCIHISPKKIYKQKTRLTSLVIGKTKIKI